jgi:DNA-binding response OmpR family regulator
MKTIVILDDESSLTDVLAATLSDAGFRAYTGANGVHGLELISKHAPDLVMVDYVMPLLDGSGVLRAMRADERLAQIPVLVMSSLPEPAISANCTGYAAFLRKPFRFEAALAAVEKAIRPASHDRLHGGRSDAVEFAGALTPARRP